MHHFECTCITCACITSQQYPHNAWVHIIAIVLFIKVTQCMHAQGNKYIKFTRRDDDETRMLIQYGYEVDCYEFFLSVLPTSGKDGVLHNELYGIRSAHT